MTLEELRNNYYDAISRLNNKDDIIAALPKTDYPNGYGILFGVLTRIKEDLDEYTELAKISEDEEDLRQISILIDACNFKIDICTDLIMKDEDVEIDNNVQQNKHLIFGTITNGNAFYERDIKEFSQEAYSDIINCLDNIKDGSSDNIEKGRTFNSNNNELIGTKESKSYQTRVLYKNIAADCAFVYLMYEKKDDKNSYLVNLMKVRKNFFIKEIADLKEALKDPQKRAEIIAKNELIEENLRSILSNKKSRKGSSR